MNRATENCGTTSKGLIYIERSPQEKEGKNGTEKYQQILNKNSPKYDLKKQKLLDSGGLVNPIQNTSQRKPCRGISQSNCWKPNLKKKKAAREK